MNYYIKTVCKTVIDSPFTKGIARKEVLKAHREMNQTLKLPTHHKTLDSSRIALNGELQ